jgi:hypothetical protein
VVINMRNVLTSGYIGLTVNPVTGSKIERNIVFSRDPTYTPFVQHRVYGQGEEPRLRDCHADNNLYFCPDDPNWARSHLVAEREFGIETRSIAADPLFEDVENGDFRWKPSSPALALGIEPIDVAVIGLLPNRPFHKIQTAHEARPHPANVEN